MSRADDLRKSMSRFHQARTEAARAAAAKERPIQEHAARSHVVPLRHAASQWDHMPDAELVQENANAIRKQTGSHKKQIREQKVRADNGRHLAKIEAQIKHSKMTISQILAKVDRLEKERASLTRASGLPSSY